MREFIKGIDISSLSEMVDQGACYFNFAGEKIEPLMLAKENGVNFVRLRLWHSPENNETKSLYCGLDETIKMSKQAKNYDMGILLDFHYSDYWADPKKQLKPKEWENLSFHQLCKEVYNYTKSVLEEMKANDVLPEYVQIGNEIRNGILFPDGSTNNWEQLAELLNCGIKAVRDVTCTTKIVLHMDQGGRCYFYREWFDLAEKYGVKDYDVIGMSYYPFWHGTYTQFAETMEYVVSKYRKQVMVVETAQGWKTIENTIYGKEQELMSGFPTSTYMQRHVLEIVMGIVASVKNNMGLGIFYWEPFMLPIKGDSVWGHNLGLVDEKGHALEGLKAFKYDIGKISYDEIIKVEEFEPIQVLRNTSVLLPQEVKVLCRDGRLYDKNVQWEKKAMEITETQIVEGIVQGTDIRATIQVIVVDEIKSDYNFIKNGNFEKGFQGWSIETNEGNVLYEIRAEFNKPFPGKPDSFLYIDARDNFEINLRRKLYFPNCVGNISFEYKIDGVVEVEILYGKSTNSILLRKTDLWERTVVTFRNDFEGVNDLQFLIKGKDGVVRLKNVVFVLGDM